MEEITDQGFVTVVEEATLFGIAEQMRSRNVFTALVTNGAPIAQADNVKGLITREQIGNAIVEANGFFSE